MKRLIVALMFWPLMVSAESISLNFREVPVINFAEATYKAILGRDLMISPEVIGLESRVTISVKSIKKSKLPKLLGEVLQSVGVRVRDQDGIIKLEKAPVALALPMDGALPLPGVLSPASDPGNDATKATSDAAPPEPVDYEVYRPQFRTVEYLQAVMSSAGLGFQGMQGQSTALDALIISGTEEKRAKLRKLIADLDRPPQVVNVRAALVEFSESHNDSWSVGGILSLLGGKLSITANAVNNATNFARLKTSIDVVLGAMNGDSRFRFRTHSIIRLVDGENGKLQVGSDVPVRGNLTITQGGYQVQATEYKPSGLVLNVLPRVFKDRVQAKVVQEVSSFAKTNTSGIDSPTLNKRLIETVVDCEDGEVVVLAGLDEENVAEGASGPFSWLPLSKSSDKRSSQLLVLLEFKRL